MTDISANATPPRSPNPIAELTAPLQRILPQTGAGRFVMLLLLAVVLWLVAISTFGVPALVWPLKLLVPAMVLGLVVLTQGM